ncbi:MAG: hypothetical protein ABIH87_02925 [bacterium]
MIDFAKNTHSFGEDNRETQRQGAEVLQFTPKLKESRLKLVESLRKDLADIKIQKKSDYQDLESDLNITDMMIREGGFEDDTVNQDLARLKDRVAQLKKQEREFIENKLTEIEQRAEQIQNSDLRDKYAKVFASVDPEHLSHHDLEKTERAVEYVLAAQMIGKIKDQATAEKMWKLVKKAKNYSLEEIKKFTQILESLHKSETVVGTASVDNVSGDNSQPGSFSQSTQVEENSAKAGGGGGEGEPPNLKFGLKRLRDRLTILLKKIKELPTSLLITKEAQSLKSEISQYAKMLQDVEPEDIEQGGEEMYISTIGEIISHYEEDIENLPVQVAKNFEKQVKMTRENYLDSKTVYEKPAESPFVSNEKEAVLATDEEWEEIKSQGKMIRVPLNEFIKKQGHEIVQEKETEDDFEKPAESPFVDNESIENLDPAMIDAQEFATLEENLKARFTIRWEEIKSALIRKDKSEIQRILAVNIIKPTLEQVYENFSTDVHADLEREADKIARDMTLALFNGVLERSYKTKVGFFDKLLYGKNVDIAWLKTIKKGQFVGGMALMRVTLDAIKSLTAGKAKIKPEGMYDPVRGAELFTQVAEPRVRRYNEEPNFAKKHWKKAIAVAGIGAVAGGLAYEAFQNDVEQPEEEKAKAIKRIDFKAEQARKKEVYKKILSKAKTAGKDMVDLKAKTKTDVRPDQKSKLVFAPEVVAHSGKIKKKGTVKKRRQRTGDEVKKMLSGYGLAPKPLDQKNGGRLLRQILDQDSPPGWKLTPEESKDIIDDLQKEKI